MIQRKKTRIAYHIDVLCKIVGCRCYYELGEILGVTDGAISRWYNEKKKISPKNVYKIIALSNGIIKFSDLRPDLIENKLIADSGIRKYLEIFKKANGVKYDTDVADLLDIKIGPIRYWTRREGKMSSDIAHKIVSLSYNTIKYKDLLPYIRKRKK